MFMVKLLNLDVKFGGRVLFTDPKIPLARNPIPQISKQPQNGPKFFENNLLNHGCLVWTGAGIMELWSLEGDSSFQSHWELRFLVPHPAARLILWSMPSVRTPKAVICGKGKPLPIEKIRKNGTCQALNSCITNDYWRPVIVMSHTIWYKLSVFETARFVSYQPCAFPRVECVTFNKYDGPFGSFWGNHSQISLFEVGRLDPPLVIAKWREFGSLKLGDVGGYVSLGSSSGHALFANLAMGNPCVQMETSSAYSWRNR